MINRRTITAVIAIITLLAAGLAMAEIKNGKKAPDFTLKTLDGKEFKLKLWISPGKDQKKVSVIAFWATWCPPCRAEAPKLQAIYEKYEKQGLGLVGVSVADDPKMVRKFVDYVGMTYTIALAPDDAPMLGTYEIRSIPILYVIDRNGAIRSSHTGYAPGSEKALEKEIKELLAEKPK